MTSSIAERVTIIRAQLPPSVRLIAVSKQVSTQLMREAYRAGIRDFGESRIWEYILNESRSLRNLHQSSYMGFTL